MDGDRGGYRVSRLGGVGFTMSGEITLKDDWTQGPAGLAAYLNTVANLLNNAEVSTGGIVELTSTGLRLEISTATPATAFDHSIAGAVVTIQPGAIRMHGLGIHALATATAVTLTGDTEWVYLELARADQSGTTAPTLAHSATEPESTATHLRIPLCKFTATGGVYSLDHRCSVGDINLDTPI